MSCEHENIRWRTSRRQGVIVVRRGRCRDCGESVKRLFKDADVPRRRRRVTTICETKVVSGPEYPSVPESGDDNRASQKLHPGVKPMNERDRILRDIESLDADSTIDDLRSELADVREAIENHELRIAERRAIELARELEHTQAVHNRRRNALLVRLEREEPQELYDLRTVIEAAFNRHALIDPPEQRTEADREEFKSWFDRGQSLSACVRVLRGLWQHADWQERLTDLIDEHRSVLPELRHVHLKETANV